MHGAAFQVNSMDTLLWIARNIIVILNARDVGRIIIFFFTINYTLSVSFSGNLYSPY